MLRDIVEKPIPMKPYFSDDAINLLKMLLERDPTKRIGFSEKDADELREHPFFSDINWKAISTKSHESVYIPKVRGLEDTSCIDKLFTKEGLEETPVDPSALN
jgi:serum/glucocorticoid-regulated kinase 2